MPSFLHIRKNALTLLIYCAIALVFVLPFRWFVAQPFIVSGASMAPTFAPNQYLIIDEMSYSFTPPKRGDVVVFRYPLDPSFFFVKRIIGVPGDTIDIDHGKVFVSMKNATTSHELIEPYVQFANKNDILAPTFLGKDEYYVLGDNRLASFDSREWGPLQIRNVVGRAVLRVYPVSTMGLVPGGYSFQDVR